MDPNNPQNQPQVPQEPLGSNDSPQPGFVNPAFPGNSTTTSQSTPATAQPVVQPTPPAAQNLPPQQTYKQGSGGRGIIKKIIMSAIGLFLAAILIVAGLTVYSSLQYPQENKISAEYIKAVRDKDYDKVGQLLASGEYEKIRKKGQEIFKRAYAIAPDPSTDPSIFDKETFYEGVLSNGEQDISIDPGEPSRIGATYHDDTNPKYLVSVYQVGEQTISVAVIYEGKTPTIIAIKDGDYNEMTNISDVYKAYKDEIKDAERELDNFELLVSQAEEQQYSASDVDTMSAKLEPKNLFAQ